MSGDEDLELRAYDEDTGDIDMPDPLATIDIHDREDGETEIVIHISDAYEIKESLKELEFQWSPGTQTWVRRKSFEKEGDADTYVETMTSKLGKLGCEVA